MRRVGEIIDVVNGRYVIRTSDDAVPEFGSQLIDQELDRIGHVVDVFGPVERPYLTVATDKSDPAVDRIGERVYTDRNRGATSGSDPHGVDTE